MYLPRPRGPLSTALIDTLHTRAPFQNPGAAIAGSTEDAQLCLWVMYELHYRGFDDADERWEWDPDLLRLRHELEQAFERTLRERVSDQLPEPSADPVSDLCHLVENDSGASLSPYVRRHASRDQALELLRHRSIYHLKESDPVAWVVPRLGTVTKAALMELQFDEYGDGDPNRLHHQLFAEGLEAAGLRPEYGAYLDEAPVEVLEVSNAMSLFGLHRRLRGAALGHLAAFEMTSSVPSRKMAQGLRRLDFPDATAAYYDEHVEADAVHEQLALRTICGSLLRSEPDLAESVFFGALTCLDLEDRYGRLMLDRWGAAA